MLTPEGIDDKSSCEVLRCVTKAFGDVPQNCLPPNFVAEQD